MKLAPWKVTLIAVVLLAMGLGVASDAKAWWYWRPAWWAAPCYYYPCATVCDPCCGGSWYVGLRPGPIRRLLLGPYRWYYSPGWSSCCVSFDCCETAVTVYSPAPQVQQPTVAPPQQPQQPQPLQQLQPLQQPPGGVIPGPAGQDAPQTLLPGANAGQITIWVPSDARVTINGYRTSSTGERRVYVSHGLRPGLTYKYEIQAEVIRNGRAVQQTRTVYLTAGSVSQLAFVLEGTPEVQLATAR